MTAATPPDPEPCSGGAAAPRGRLHRSRLAQAARFVARRRWWRQWKLRRRDVALPQGDALQGEVCARLRRRRRHGWRQLLHCGAASASSLRCGPLSVPGWHSCCEGAILLGAIYTARSRLNKRGPAGPAALIMINYAMKVASGVEHIFCHMQASDSKTWSHGLHVLAGWCTLHHLHHLPHRLHPLHRRRCPLRSNTSAPPQTYPLLL